MPAQPREGTEELVSGAGAWMGPLDKKGLERSARTAMGAEASETAGLRKPQRRQGGGQQPGHSRVVSSGSGSGLGPTAETGFAPLTPDNLVIIEPVPLTRLSDYYSTH